MEFFSKCFTFGPDRLVVLVVSMATIVRFTVGMRLRPPEGRSNHECEALVQELNMMAMRLASAWELPHYTGLPMTQTSLEVCLRTNIQLIRLQFCIQNPPTGFEMLESVVEGAC